MLDRIYLDRELLESEPSTLRAPLTFAACLKDHGSYTTEHFVLRLSPRNHELVDGISSGIYTAGELDGETIQAFSTYLHETVHWWQHVGSTSGLVLSLAYPAQAHQNTEHLRKVVERAGLKKPIKRWAEDQALAGATIDQPELRAANIAVNNTVDAAFYKMVTRAPPTIMQALDDRYFESLGHCYWMAYGHALALLTATVDRGSKHLPDGLAWDEGFRRVRDAQVEGFVHAGPVRVAPLGLHALFEGQARMLQLQYLTFGVEHPPSCEELRAEKQFDGIYGEAFKAFLKITNSAWPARIDDPLIAAFLLIVDLALNPTRGIPLDIESFENFILDVDPGIRFLRLSQEARDRPELLSAITDYSREEYIAAAAILTEACGYDDPAVALRTIRDWATSAPGVAKVMAEKATFAFDPSNLVVRVFLSHFVAFSADKLQHPEFFCWAGAWMAGSRVGKRSQQLFLRHLSLYTDKADDEGIFPRMIPGVDPRNLTETLNIFYGNIVLYDLIWQWILGDGPFRYNYAWLTKSDMTEWAKALFENAYGVHPDRVEVLQPDPI